jgi:hypothetical protein
MSRADVLPFPTLAIPARFAQAPGVVLNVRNVLSGQSLGPLIDDGSEFLLIATAVMASAFARLTSRQPRIVPH